MSALNLTDAELARAYVNGLMQAGQLYSSTQEFGDALGGPDAIIAYWSTSENAGVLRRMINEGSLAFSQVEGDHPCLATVANQRKIEISL